MLSVSGVFSSITWSTCTWISACCGVIFVNQFWIYFGILELKLICFLEFERLGFTTQLLTFSPLLFCPCTHLSCFWCNLFDEMGTKLHSDACWNSSCVQFIFMKLVLGFWLYGIHYLLRFIVFELYWTQNCFIRTVSNWHEPLMYYSLISFNNCSLMSKTRHKRYPWPKIWFW